MIVSNDTIIARWPEHGPERENVPNARLIVRAVNNFQPMLDALRELLREVDAHLDYETDVEMGVAADVARAILNAIEGDQ